MSRTVGSTLDGRTVQALAGGARLVLHLDGGLLLTVENDFRLRRGAEVDHFYPALGLSPTGLLADLATATITTAAATPAGGLHLAFDTGHTLDIAPDSPTRPWHLASPTGVLFTGGPLAPEDS